MEDIIDKENVSENANLDIPAKTANDDKASSPASSPRSSKKLPKVVSEI